MIEPVACDPVVRPVDRDQAGRLPAHSHPLLAYPRLRKSNKCSLRGAAVARMLTMPPDVRATTGTTVPTATAPALLLLQVPPIFPHIKQTS